MRLDKGWMLLALWLLAGAVQAQDDTPGRVGRLVALQGEVWVQEAGQGEWLEALPNRPFTGGERLATGPDASAELRIGSTTVFLGGQTEFEALRLDDERLQFRLQRGQLALRLTSSEVANELEVTHPEARLLPRRAGFYRVDRLAEASDVTVWRGEMQVEAHHLSLTLHAGQRAAFWREGPLGDTTHQWLTPQDDAFAQAVQREDQRLAQFTPSALVPAEMTGVEDLQRYGHWQPHPEVGAVWIPSSVAAGWAPYRHGQWTWVQPWGWTWVDAAPWGFAPFHYGRWLWWGNRWCWTPGPRVARPVYAPALVGWIGPPPLGARTRPPVHGWVPLAPREVYVAGYRASPGHLRGLNPHVPGGPAPLAPPPVFANRGVAGRETAPPSPGMPRQPSPAGDDWRGQAGLVPGSPRPPREPVRPRAVWPAAPIEADATPGSRPPATRAAPESTAAPMSPRPPRPAGPRWPGSPATPATPAPPPSALASPPAPGAAPERGPFGGPLPRSAQADGPRPRERAPPTPMPMPMPMPMPGQATRTAPASTLRPPPTSAAVPQPPAVAAPRQASPEVPVTGRGAEPGERRPLPQGRQPGRER